MNTSIGSMLQQMLEAMGMDVVWYEQLPAGAEDASGNANQEAAVWIKKVSRRPGAHMKQLSQQQCQSELEAGRQPKPIKRSRRASRAPGAAGGSTDPVVEEEEGEPMAAEADEGEDNVDWAEYAWD